MKASVVVFPGSNCDRDVAAALQQATGAAPAMVWHGETALPPSDLIVLPGGFSYGDYLRSGAMAARSPIMADVVARANDGVLTLGICNGFQALTECGLLPGALMRNAGLTFICKTVALTVEAAESPFTRAFAAGETVRFPIAHHDGNYFADTETLDRLEGEGRIAFRYADTPNGSQRAIAGVLNESGNVLGLMPHPERAIAKELGGIDGKRFFEGLMG